MSAATRARSTGLLLAVLAVIAPVVIPSTSAAAPGSARCGDGATVGARIPLLFVHGFISDTDAWDTAIDRFCTDKVHASAFDYSHANTNWVTDPAIGPALATAILRLANASRDGEGPGKVLLVGHSMGGLAIRCAADGRCNGGLGAPPGQPSPVAEAIGGITTFDSPNHGSFLRGYGLAGVPNDAGDLLSAAVCSGVDLGLAPDPIDDICYYIRAFGTSDAADAFTPGSPELTTL